MNHIYMLGLITNRGMRERFLHFFREYHIEVTFAALGRGTAGSARSWITWAWRILRKRVYFAVSHPGYLAGTEEGPVRPDADRYSGTGGSPF